MLKQVLTEVLTKEQRESGLWLDEVDDHILELKQDWITRATFLTANATIQEIQKEAQKWVNSF